MSMTFLAIYQLFICIYILTDIYQSILIKITYIHLLSILLKGDLTMQNYGKIEIHLSKLLQEKGISKRKLSFWAEMERKQINALCKNEVQRLDLNILARLCNALDCSVSDILEYIPSKHE